MQEYSPGEKEAALAEAEARERGATTGRMRRRDVRRRLRAMQTRARKQARRAFLRAFDERWRAIRQIRTHPRHCQAHQTPMWWDIPRRGWYCAECGDWQDDPNGAEQIAPGRWMPA